MSFGENPQIFTPISYHQQQEPSLGTECSRYRPYPDQQKDHYLHDSDDTVLKIPKFQPNYYIQQPNWEGSVINASNITQPTELRDKPKAIRRISIDTLIHDSDDGLHSQSTNSSQFGSSQDSHQSASLVNSVDAQRFQEISTASLKDPNLNFLAEVKKSIHTPEGFRIGCAGLSKWLQEVSFIIAPKFAEELIDLIDDIIKHALKDDFNPYSAYFLLYEMARHKSYSFACFNEMLTPWVNFFKKYISSKVDDARRVVPELKAAKLDTPIFPRDFRQTVLMDKKGRPVPKSLVGKYRRSAINMDLNGSFYMPGDPEENLTYQNVQLTKELGPFASLEKKYHTLMRFSAQNLNLRNSIPKFTRVSGYLIAPVVIKSESTYVDVNFSIDRAQCREFDPKIAMTEHILQLYCYEESDPHQHLKWPEGMYVEINSFEIPVKSDASSNKTLDQCYISNNHPPTISGYLKGDHNLLNFRFKYTRDKNYVIQLRKIELLSRRKAYDSVLSNNLAQKSDWEYLNDHIFAMPCCITQKMMDAPTKGKHCRHTKVLAQ